MSQNAKGRTLVAVVSPGPTQQASGVTIPDETRAKYPQLVDLILGSESMNDEERQYWVNILPIMTPDQVKNLESILTNEKQQLAAIDKKYATQIAATGTQQTIETMDAERQRRVAELSQKEQQEAHHEEKAAEEILRQINEL